MTRHRAVTIAFVAFCVGAAAVRYLVLVQDAPAPATVDGGNWLAFGRGLFGDHIRSSTIVYPPVVPVAVLVAVSLLGAAAGVAAVAAVTSLAPALGMYVALRGRVPDVVATGAAALLAVAASTGEAAAWGGYPQLVGFGLAMVFLRCLDDALTESSDRRWMWTGLLFAGLLATTHLIAAAVALTAAGLIGLHVAARRQRPRLSWRHAAWLVGPSLLLLPVYAPLLAEILSGLDDRPSFVRLNFSDVPDHLQHIYRDFELLWLPLLVLAFLTPVALADRWRTPLWRLLVALVVSATVCTVALHEARFLYFYALPAVVALGLWAAELRRLRTFAASVLAVALVLQTWFGLRLFDGQYEFYAEVDEGMYAAITWLADETDEDTRVAVANSTDLPVGWWVEGLARRRALVGSPLRWLTFEDEQRRALQANDIFSETFPDEAAFALARRYRVEYLLVPSKWAGGPRSRVRAFARAHPDRVAVENPSAVIFRV